MLAVAFALGLMTKPMLVTLPFLLVLLDVWPLARVPFRVVARGGTARRGEAAAHCDGVRGGRHHDRRATAGGAVRTSAEVPLAIRFGNAALAYVGYVRKMLWPVDLAPFYPLELSLSAWRVAALRRGTPARDGDRDPCRAAPAWVTVGWLWFLGSLVPVIRARQVGLQAMADRYTYVPLIGLFVSESRAGAAEASERWRVRPALQGVAALLVLGGCFVATRAQVAFWRNSLTLFERDFAR